MQNQVNLWIGQSRGGDREAFAKIVSQYQTKVCAVTFSMTGDLQKSEDIAQETFLTAWNKLGDLQEPEKIGAWLCAIARSLCKKGFLRNRRDPLHAAAPIDSNGVEPAEISPLPEEMGYEKRREQADWAWAAIAGIPEQYREPMVLYYREGHSVREVAETLELTETCVKTRLHRGREYLKQELELLGASARAATRPDTAFTVAVLASLPLAATASGCTATSVGSAIGSQSGWSLFWTVGFCLCAPVILVTGGFWGLWTAIKHSPTVRTRRFMCRAALQWYLFIWVFMLVKLKIDHGYGGWNTHGGAFFFGYFGILIVYCSWLVDRWRMLLEEDAGLRSGPVKPLEKTGLSRFWLRCWYWGTLLPVVIFSLLMAFDLISEFRREPHFDEVFGIWAIPLLTAVCVLWMSIPLGFFLVVGCGLQTAKDEKSLLRWYPNRAFLPKPEEKTHRGWFLFDRSVMLLSTVLPMIVLTLFGMLVDGLAAWVLISTMMMTVATLIASHSAGIPGKRLGGYVRLWMIVGLIYAVLMMMGQGRFFMVSICFGITISLQIVKCVGYIGLAFDAFILSKIVNGRQSGA